MPGSFISWFLVTTIDTTMEVYRISAVTLKVKDVRESCKFYSKLPGFTLVYREATDRFASFEVGKGTKMHLNLQSAGEISKVIPADPDSVRKDFGRIIFHTDDVDGLYRFMRNDSSISQAVLFETEPADAAWGERFFHLREPDGYQLSFAQPITKEIEKYYCE